MEQIINVYTDGSCHPQTRAGCWGAYIFIDGHKTILHSIVQDTTHNRMELMAVIEAVDFIRSRQIENQRINIHTDSQYVVNIEKRYDKLRLKNFLTKNGTPVQNSDLVQTLIKQIDSCSLHFIKVKGHEKNTETRNYNREVDMFVRKMLREYLRNI